MNRLNAAIGIALALTWTGAALAQHEHGEHAQHGKVEQPKQAETQESKLPLCPLMDEPVDFTVKTLTGEGAVYFCCKECIPKYEKDPAKYAQKVAAQREALKKLERIQVSCPVSGNPIDGKTFAMFDDQGVNFCCKDCPPKYGKDPAKYKAKLEASYTYQTKCPVSGDKIDPTAFTDLSTGQRIYLCCAGCGEKLLKDPAKYAPKLAEQGVNVDVKKLKGEKPKHDEHGGHEHDHP
jgi:YHS domain-containing protein